MKLKNGILVKSPTERAAKGAQKRPGALRNAQARPQIPSANVGQQPKNILHASAKAEKYFSCVVDEWIDDFEWNWKNRILIKDPTK